MSVANYLLDNYGVCIRGGDADCLCLKPGAKWLGRGCIYWKPTGATTYEQLSEAQKVLNGLIAKTNRPTGP